MKATIESTVEIVPIGYSLEARVWKGVTEGGIPFAALVYCVLADSDLDLGEFEAELQSTLPLPRGVAQVVDDIMDAPAEGALRLAR